MILDTYYAGFLTFLAFIAAENFRGGKILKRFGAEDAFLEYCEKIF